MKTLFSKHLDKRIKELSTFLEKSQIDNLYIESGFPDYYFKDDQPTFFKSNPYFNFFCPDQGQGHLLKFSKVGGKPKLYYFIPDDFWHETSRLKGDFWEEFFEIEVCRSTQDLWMLAESKGTVNSIISPNPKMGLSHSCALASDEFYGELNWMRTQKTDYEIQCIRMANKAAALGHQKAKDLFYNGATESQIFTDYMIASGQRESELPYNSIVAFDQNTAILHYQFPKNTSGKKTFLIDAGARHLGYCSDITRTYFTNSAHEIFKNIHAEIEKDQKTLCSKLRANQNYVDIHKTSFENVAHLLIETKIFKGSFEQAIESNLPFTFYPHGVGHPIGLQVHDLGGKQQDSSGKTVQQPDQFPYLRTLRTIQENDVLTIEPGFYFIPMLLEKLRNDRAISNLMDWSLIEELIPCGGIRVEDNVVARLDSAENLTRPFLP